MSGIVDPFGNLSTEEKAKLEAVVKSGSEIDPVPRVPDAPDIDAEVKVKLRLLREDEIPTPGIHYVLWGHGSLGMTDEYPVLKSANLNEIAYVTRMGLEAEELVEGGLKDPTPGAGYPKTRRLRAEMYARWRYRGYITGEVASL